MQKKALLKNAKTASNKSIMLFPNIEPRDTRQDAFRHAYWSALNAYEQGESLARQFGNAHEEEDNQEEFDRTMDLYNNNYGYEVGVSARENGYDESWIESEIIWAIDNNILKFLL